MTGHFLLQLTFQSLCHFGEPLRFDADAIIGGLGGSPSTTAVRTAFMLCHIIPMMNSFLASYKRDAC